MDPPPSHRLYPAQNPLYLHSLPSVSIATDAAAAAPFQPHDPTIYTTPMSPYKPPNPTSYSLPQPPFPSTAIPYAANSAVFYPPSSSSNVGLPHQHAYYPFPRSHVVNNHPPIPQPNHNDDYVGKLRNEVIFLHQLWHQGPPNSNSNFGDSVGNLHPHLKPSHSTAFKKKKKKNSPPIPVSDNPWPVPPDPSAPPESESGWPEFPPRPTPLAPVAIQEDRDRDRVSATRVQHKAMNSFRSFFAGKHGPESESESDDDFHDEDDASEDDCAKFDKFLEVFEGDVELKEYYEKNWANGEFLCLVCGGSGQMVGRKYKNCLALVQHTVTISNTKKRAAHRAYGQVLCKVLGWDINQLPLVSRNLSLQQGNDMTSAEACKDDLVGIETNLASFVHENEQPGPSMATSDVAEENATEKMETSDLPSILDNPGDQQGNEMSSFEACKDDPVGVETNIVSLVNDNEQSDTSKATSEVREDIAAEKKETSDLPLVLANPGDRQINDTSNAGTSSNHSDTAEENPNAILNECGLSDPPKAGTDTGNDNAAEKKETSSLPCTVTDFEGSNADQYVSVHEPAT